MTDIDLIDLTDLTLVPQDKKFIKLVPDTAYERLHGRTPEPVPENLIAQTRQLLARNDLADLVDPTEYVSIPIPEFKGGVDKWVEEKIILNNKPYLKLLDKFSKLDTQKIQRPGVSPYQGWSKFTGTRWEKCDFPDTDGIFFDFETYKGVHKHYKPFMCSAVDLKGTVYSWLHTDDDRLPEVVAFGDRVKLLGGHNAVSYDRRYVKEFYDYAHDKRMIDTFSLYSILLGMTETQMHIWEATRYSADKPDWARVTSKGNLKDLAEFLCGLNLDKDVKHLWVTRDSQPPKSFSAVRDNLCEIWDYCISDTISTVEVFKKLISRIYSFTENEGGSRIYLAGQLERSTLRIGVRGNITEFQDKINAHNTGVISKLNKRIWSIFIDKIKQRDKYLLEFIEGFLIKDYYLRIYKSAAFQKFAKSYDVSTLDDENLESVILPSCLMNTGWEFDAEDLSPRGLIKNATLKKLVAVQFALNKGLKVGKIKPGSINNWLKNAQKAPKEFSLTGKVLPLILGVTWKSKRLVIRKNTWGIIKNGNFIPLPHPKGEGDVGNPLGKDFLPRVLAGELQADLPLKDLFGIIAETNLWEKFDGRFSEVYTYNNIWLPVIVPSGTVSGRMTGALALVMPKVAPDRAGSEMATLFGASSENTELIGADFSANESEIFCGLAASETGYFGLTVYEWLVVVHDIHSYVAKVLSQGSPIEIPRPLAKNMNFANQFFCGVNKLANMAYVGLNGQQPMDFCLSLAEKFITATRGENNYGIYENGMASVGFNAMRRRSRLPRGKLPGVFKQVLPISGRPISDALQVNVGHKSMTTCLNYNIQGTGQDMADVACITIRALCKLFGIQYQFAFMIHDQIIFEVPKQHRQDFLWIMQIGHLVSKAVFYSRINVNNFPQKFMWFESIEIDHVLRKSPLYDCITPTNKYPIPPGISVKAKDCLPSTRIMDILSEPDILV